MKNPIRSLAARLTPGTYVGARAALIPFDLGLSLLAKRSYYLFRLWERYESLTRPLFGRLSQPGNSEQQRLVRELRADGAITIESTHSREELAAAREWVVAAWRSAKARAAEIDPSGTRDEVTWD